jgi:hypothetical protein
MGQLSALPHARTRRNVTIVAGVAVACLLASALVLWAHLGTAVFFEAIRAGIAYCF